MTNIIIGTGQTGDGIVVGGKTYAIASDWGSAGGTGFTLTHVQVVKLGWGDNYNTYRTTTDKPLPVQFYSSNNSGSTGAIVDNNYGLKVTGDVRINSSLEIAGGQIDGNLKNVVSGILQVVGPTFGKSGPTGYAVGHTRDYHFNPIKITGAVQGFTAAYPIGVTYGGGQPGRGPGEGLIRRLYGGPVGYTGYTGINLQTKPGAGQNSSILARDIDYVAVQGMSGGFGVGITASRSDGLLTRRLSFPYNQTPTAEDSKTPDGDRVGIVGIKGATAVEVTGGVRLVHAPAGGSMEIRNLSAGRDNVAVWGADGGTAAHVKLFHSDGTPIGISAGALKVAIDNGTFTGNVTLSTNVYARNATGGVLKVQGKTGAEVVVKGPLSGGALEVASPSGLNIRSLTSSDTVGLAGGAAEDLGQIQTDVSTGSGRLGNIQTNTENLINKVTELNYDVNKMTGTGTEESNVDSEQIAFNTHIHRVYQPTELISLSKPVGSNTVQLDTNTVIYNGVYVSADSANTEDIMVGNQSLVSNNSAGYVLAPGETVFLQVANMNRIYVRSASGTQTVRCIGS